MKLIIIADKGWIASKPIGTGSKLIRMVYSLAAENGYHIVVEHQHWPK